MIAIIELHNKLLCGLAFIGFFTTVILMVTLLNFSSLYYTIERPASKVTHNN